MKKSQKIMSDEKINKLNIIFMGTSKFAEIVLQSLIKSNRFSIVVFTKSNKSFNGKKNFRKNFIKELAAKNKIQIEQPDKFDKRTISRIKKMKQG